MTSVETVIEVFPLKISSKRYDITVEGNENFFANGVLVHNCQNLQRQIFETHKGESYEVTLKLDGSSCTVYAKDGDIGVCSRNLDLKETEGNSFWQAARKQLLIEALTKLQTVGMGNFALQMELLGPGIQGNQENLKEHRLFLFDVYNIDKQAYLNPVERQRLLDSLLDAGADLEHAPVLDPSLVVTDRFSSVEELLAFADGPSLNPDTKREGVVFKSTGGNFSFKAISNSYLLKHKDR